MKFKYFYIIGALSIVEIIISMIIVTCILTFDNQIFNNIKLLIFCLWFGFLAFMTLFSMYICALLISITISIFQGRTVGRRYMALTEPSMLSLLRSMKSWNIHIPVVLFPLSYSIFPFH